MLLSESISTFFESGKIMIEFDGYNSKSFDAGFKARADVKYFYNRMGIKTAEIPATRVNLKINRELQRLRAVRSLSKKLSADQSVLIQYPLPFNSFDYSLLHKTLLKHNAKCIFLVHDLISVQGQAKNVSIKQEIEELKRADFLIVHNQAMQNFLEDQGLSQKMATINFFDYRVDVEPPIRSEVANIVFAGNLVKSKFLKKLPQLEIFKWHVYGSGMTAEQFPESVVFHGAIDSGVLPSKLVDGWGLVWDGISTDRISGVSGDYLRLNSPHKASLYLASGLPLIVWRESALANVVLQLGLGIAVDNLMEIEPVIKSLSHTQIEKIQTNVQIISQKIRNGGMLKDALESLPVGFDA